MGWLRWTVFLLAAGIPAHAPTAGKAPASFHDCVGCPEMIVIPAGQFLMGSPTTEPGHDDVESPQHLVSIRRFAAGKFDVPRGEWRAFVSATRRPTATGCQWVGPTRDHEATSSWRKLDFVQTDRHPVVCVTWQDAQDYAHWLSSKTGKHYRLLSEAEWEYAARGGSTTPFWWAKGASHEFANHGTAKCCGGLAIGRDRWMFTSPVGSFPANPFGLFDMGGNVLQFVADCFVPTYDSAPSDGSAITRSTKLQTSGALSDLSGTNSCDYRVARGGDWGDQAGWIRSAARNFAPPPGPDDSLATYRSGGVGFRVARDLP